ncbi:AAA family ATPase [Estrella lausannensis]|uniref:MoxR-like ATPase n=1 Tax=Estrella lausannensis TaxID=483423 RepID=A0A0H5E402_9BACT|nr:MoxR family ATPase [Estrella lausannensis]CRX37945.1 MoxR-like ATPase [Estrella lausannensis]
MRSVQAEERETFKKAARHPLSNLLESIQSKIIGQHQIIEQMLVCLLTDGHALLEGMPGLAKTRSAKAIADGIKGDFHRIQFTPDLLPSDLIGTEIYVHEKSDFVFRKGPLFNNILLADEINRAPAKVQSALLEAMEEKQVTVGHKSYALPELYMVIATQNPIEQEGTYNLPEAQLDRFMMHLEVKYPTHDEELQIVELDEKRQQHTKESPLPLTTEEEVLAARQAVSRHYISDSLKKYVVSLASATRTPEKYDRELAKWIVHGVSPRATIALIRCAKALAWLRGDEYVTPSHIHEVAFPVLRHRIYPSFESEADGISRNTMIQKLLDVVAIP